MYGRAGANARFVNARKNQSRARPNAPRAGAKPGPIGGMPGVGRIQMLGVYAAVGMPSFSPAMSAAGSDRSATSTSARAASAAAIVSRAHAGAGLPRNETTY